MPAPMPTAPKPPRLWTHCIKKIPSVMLRMPPPLVFSRGGFSCALYGGDFSMFCLKFMNTRLGKNNDLFVDRAVFAVCDFLQFFNVTSSKRSVNRFISVLSDNIAVKKQSLQGSNSDRGNLLAIRCAYNVGWLQRLPRSFHSLAMTD